MVTNRSVPPDVLPHVIHRDVAQASAWLTATLGFTELPVRATAPQTRARDPSQDLVTAPIPDVPAGAAPSVRNGCCHGGCR
jgi:hypothetical protein